MEIISAKKFYVPEIVEIWKEFIDFHKKTDPFFNRRKDGHLNFGKHVKRLIKSKDSQVLVALERGNVMAYSIAHISKHPPVFHCETYGLISDLAVKPQYRKKGVGKKILKKMFGWFKLHKIDRIELRVAARNRIGYSFWKKHGFKDYMHVLWLDI